MFVNIKLNKKIKSLIVVLIITIALTGIYFTYMLTSKNSFKSDLDLSFTNYYAEYDMTVISNKNINTYSIKEWHKEGKFSKLEYLDYMKNKVTILLENETCNISNMGNISKLVINNMYENQNITSLSTFGYLYNKMEQNCSCVRVKEDEDGEIVVTINLKDTCTCGCNKIANELGISSLELVLVNKLPKNYTVLDKNKNEYISIVYNVYNKI